MTCQRHNSSASSARASAASTAGFDLGGPSLAPAFVFDVRSPDQAFFDLATPASETMLDADHHTVSISGKAYSLLCHLRRDGESDATVTERALAGLDAYRIVERALRFRELRKAYTVARQMRRRGFSEETTTAMCRALFGAQSEKDLRSAFRLLDLDESGCIDKDELRCALPLMSEDVPEEQIEELFRLVDVDGSGLIDFEEFSTLVRGLNPKMREDGVPNAFSQFQKSTEGGLDAVGDVLDNVATSASSTLSAISTAWSADLPGLSAMEMRKVGAVLANMRKEGYSEKMAQSICRALFCEQNEKQLQRAFRFYDKDRNGSLDAQEFRKALPLMGENVPGEQIEKMFKKLAVDESGRINFEGFCKLVKGMNPKKKLAKQEPDALAVVSNAWGRVSRTWAAKTKPLQDEEPASAQSAGQARTSDGSSRRSVPSGSSRRSGSAPQPGSNPGGGESTALVAVAGGGSRSSSGVVTLPPRAQRVSVMRQVARVD